MKTPSQGRCSRCKEWKWLNTHNRCEGCDKEYHAEYRNKNREKINQRMRDYRKAHPERKEYEKKWHHKKRIDRIKNMSPQELLQFRKKETLKTMTQAKQLVEKVFNAYGSKCACCGESEPIFLTMDHILNDGAKKRTIHGQSYSFYRWIIKNNYPKDLQRLCRNCNWGKYANHGICPHRQGVTTIPSGSSVKRHEMERAFIEGREIVCSA